ncbi:tetratricopeptide repeat protein [Paraburkholderia guartelaensis]|uniref:tetratricopeptide repeat protein n=1 Tax=Paraburkholderia guartelaensis TaxID=2546446 RepID=UPI002AB63582|nr:NB-ARC domain-containing protein [Paraburkholderia guartelaensis]
MRIAEARNSFPPINRLFTGREAILKKLDLDLQANRIAALSGMGGVGKTQIANAYGWSSSCLVAFWVHADTKEKLLAGLVSYARQLGLAEVDDDEKDVANRFAVFLSRSDNWLLVFDNVEDVGVLSEVIPRGKRGKIVVTTQLRSLDAISVADPISVGEMSPEDAFDFLKRRTGRTSLTVAEELAARDISAELGYLPLALEQAASYVKEIRCTFVDYLASWKKLDIELLERGRPAFGDYHHSVATTWKLNFDRLKRTSRQCPDVLFLSAFLDPDEIPIKLVKDGAAGFSDELYRSLRLHEDEPTYFYELLELLSRYSLIKVNEEAYSIHRLVQLVIRDGIRAEVRSDWLSRATETLRMVAPQQIRSQSTYADQWSRNVRQLDEFSIRYCSVSPALGRLLFKAANYAENTCRYADAESLYLRAEGIFLARPGECDTDAVWVSSALYVHYQHLGKYEESVSRTKQRQRRIEEELGRDHPDLLAEKAISDCFGDGGEALLRAAIALRGSPPSRDDPYFFDLVTSLAMILADTSNYKEHDELLRRAIRFAFNSRSERRLEDVCDAFGLLAMGFFDRGDTARGKRYMVKGLKMCRNWFGHNSEEVASHLGMFAIYCEGRVSHRFNLRALKILEKLFGPEDIKVADHLSHMGVHYADRQNYKDALEPAKRALSIFDKLLPPEHFHTHLAVKTYAETVLALGDKAEFERLKPRYYRSLKRVVDSNKCPDS